MTATPTSSSIRDEMSQAQLSDQLARVMSPPAARAVASAERNVFTAPLSFGDQAIYEQLSVYRFLRILESDR